MSLVKTIFPITALVIVSGQETTTSTTSTCIDKFPEQCSSIWKNFCDDPSIKANCPYTCDSCTQPPPPVETCQDSDPEICKSHTAGTCLINKVALACKQTCGICDPSSKTELLEKLKAAQEQVNNALEQAKNIKETLKGNGTCADVNSEMCSVELCTVPKFREKFENVCKKTCGLCPGDTPVPVEAAALQEDTINALCNDIFAIENCIDFKEKDYCEKESIQKVCAKTCGTCAKVLEKAMKPTEEKTTTVEPLITVSEVETTETVVTDASVPSEIETEFAVDETEEELNATADTIESDNSTTTTVAPSSSGQVLVSMIVVFMCALLI